MSEICPVCKGQTKFHYEEKLEPQTCKSCHGFGYIYPPYSPYKFYNPYIETLPYWHYYPYPGAVITYTTKPVMI